MKLHYEELIPGLTYRFTWHGAKGVLYCERGEFTRVSFEKGLIWCWFWLWEDDGVRFEVPETYTDLLTLELVESQEGE